MLTSIYVQKKLSDGTQLEISVHFSNGKFTLSDVGVKQKGKRKFESVCGTNLTDNYSYRRLDAKGRRKMELEKMLEVAPIEVLNQALEEAWLSLKPKKLTEADFE